MANYTNFKAHLLLQIQRLLRPFKKEKPKAHLFLPNMNICVKCGRGMEEVKHIPCVK